MAVHRLMTLAPLLHWSLVLLEIAPVFIFLEIAPVLALLEIAPVLVFLEIAPVLVFLEIAPVLVFLEIAPVLVFLEIAPVLVLLEIAPVLVFLEIAFLYRSTDIAPQINTGTIAHCRLPACMWIVSNGTTSASHQVGGRHVLAVGHAGTNATNWQLVAIGDGYGDAVAASPSPAAIEEEVAGGSAGVGGRDAGASEDSLAVGLRQHGGASRQQSQEGADEGVVGRLIGIPVPGDKGMSKKESWMSGWMKAGISSL